MLPPQNKLTVIRAGGWNCGDADFQAAHEANLAASTPKSRAHQSWATATRCILVPVCKTGS